MPTFRQLRATLRCAVLGVGLCFGVNVFAQEPGTAPPGAAAGEPALRMTWESDDPACSGDDVSVRALQMVTPGVTVRPLRATVQVQRDDDHWLVRLQTESGDASGRRILRAQSCKELQEAIALLLAMAMESKGDILPPDSPAPEPEPAPPTAAAAPVEPVPAPPLTPPSPDMRDQRPAADGGERGVALGWFARLDGKAADGLKPGLGLGAGISGGVRVGSFDIGIGAEYWPETRKQAPGRAGFVDIARQSLSLHVCWNAWRSGALVLAPCLNPGVLMFTVQSSGLRRTLDNRSKPLASVTAGLDLRYELFAGGLSFLVSPAVTWERPQPFQIELTDEPLADGPPAATAFEEIYKTRGFGPSVAVGVDARF